MGIYNLREIGDNRTTISTPVCIIGAGMAGLLLARRLAQAGRNVTLIESGLDFYDPEIQRLNEIEDLNGSYKWPVTGRARGLGGTSSLWGGRIISLSQQEAESVCHPSLSGWPFSTSELEAYRPEIERVFKLDHSSFEEDILGDLDRRCHFPSADPDVTCRWIKWATFKRGNLTALLKSELQQAKNIDIWLGATVCGLDYDEASGRLLAIQASSLEGHRVIVRANEFVFAAGTIETTRLLLLLDEASGKRAFHRCRVLGRYFQDHLDAQVGWLRPKDRTVTNMLFAPRFFNSIRRSPHLELNRDIAGIGFATGASFAHIPVNLTENRVLSVVKNMYDNLCARKFDLNLGAFSEIGANYKLLSKFVLWRLLKRQFFIPDDIDYKLHICIEQAPHPNNRILLSDKRDRLGVPMVRLSWSPMEPDEQTFRTSVARIGAYWRRSGFDNICPIEWTPAAKDASMLIIDQAEDWCHPSGTTRMGLDPAESVVGPDMTCHDVPNVRVVSASIFPISGSVNPTLTIMQLALRCADLILERSASEPVRPGLAA
ncbi:FAD-dependent oxidoreductase [Microvirga tunisiensis]|uniref:GMC family oxidoreductase n=1 Tax=Microvirga tunisiensis TaxID=2108360 RepID=A0A5N7MW81_9HYPH|nr:GMC family oxidoreductase [Microvirga tunisiensis]MPR13359.1 GMC family oxidoreductase [Microvirga tunisiensis]MPR31232.1 GMC family oxidoreductase [Microvirga tunisiensis]